MLRTKLAVVLIPSLGLSCAIAAAQELPSNCMVKAPETPLVFAVPQGDSYGSYTPYTGPPPQAIAESKDVASCSPPSTLPPAPINSSKQTPPLPTIPDKIQSKITDVPPLSCNTELWVADKVYGAYVPYTGPVKACFVATETAHNASPLNLSPSIELPADLVRSTAPPASELAIAPGGPTPSGAAGSTSEYVRVVPVPAAVTGPLVDMRPFKTYAVGFTADTLGTGVEIATPLAGSFNLRSSFHFFAFNDPFSIDGIDYTARLHLQSSQTTLDWFFGKNLHVSPGVLYTNNAMSAPASVAPGKTFVLGNQTYTNSVDDPVTGTSGVIFPHKFAPLLLIGWGNILPRSGKRLTFPIEVGAAYTGASVIAVGLNGTACTTQGCYSFASSQKIQSDLNQEINILNEDLKRYPVFPIASIGVAYHF
jgi:hypothetical protein